MTKTAEEIEDLKANWKSDPCWDIEDTEGFEEYHKGLSAWRKEYELEQEFVENERLTDKARLLRCSVELVRYIEYIESRLAKVTK